jgi:hypothetical protein
MSAEITRITTAAETAALVSQATPAQLATLDPATLTAVTSLLQAAAELSRAGRPIVVHEPALAPAAAAPTPTPPHADPPATWPPATRPGGYRPVLFGDKLVSFGSGAVATGAVGALVALTTGFIWVLTISAAGAILVGLGAAAVNHAETRLNRGRS